MLALPTKENVMGVLLGDDSNHYRVNHRGDLEGERGFELYSPNRTQVRSARLGAMEREPRPDPKRGMLIVGLTLMIAAVYGLYLLWEVMS